MTDTHETPITGNRLTAGVYVCATTCGNHDRQRTTVAELRRLVEEGPLDDVDRHLWPGRITTSDRDEFSRVVEDTYDEFAAWARVERRALGPAFSRTTVRNEFSDEEYEVVRFPVLTLAVRADGDVVRVAPTGEDDRRYTVDDCLAELRALAGDRTPDRAPTLES